MTTNRASRAENLAQTIEEQAQEMRANARGTPSFYD
jgi:hypothetical protein